MHTFALLCLLTTQAPHLSSLVNLPGVEFVDASTRTEKENSPTSVVGWSLLIAGGATATTSAVLAATSLGLGLFAANQYSAYQNYEPSPGQDTSDQLREYSNTITVSTMLSAATGVSAAVFFAASTPLIATGTYALALE